VTEYLGHPLRAERNGIDATARAHILSGTPHIPEYLESERPNHRKPKEFNEAMSEDAKQCQARTSVR
jgi:hypothetical protein